MRSVRGAVLLVLLVAGGGCGGTSNKNVPRMDATIASSEPDGAGSSPASLCTEFPDACAALVGAAFRSKSWGTLRFGKQKWVWKFSDAGESGDYTCKDGRIEATSSGGTKHPGEIVGPDCNSVNWDSYGAFQLNGARDPNAPEPLP